MVYARRLARPRRDAGDVRRPRDERGDRTDDHAPRFLAVTNDVFDADRHWLTVWLEADYAGGDAAPVAAYELSEVGWFHVDDLPSPLFLSLEHLVDGESLPRNAWSRRR